MALREQRTVALTRCSAQVEAAPVHSTTWVCMGMAAVKTIRRYRAQWEDGQLARSTLEEGNQRIPMMVSGSVQHRLTCEAAVCREVVDMNSRNPLTFSVDLGAVAR